MYISHRHRRGKPILWSLILPIRASILFARKCTLLVSASSAVRMSFFMVPTCLPYYRIRYVLSTPLRSKSHYRLKIQVLKIAFSLGILDLFINHRVHTVLGRITYSVFLMNTLSLITLTASVRTPVFYSYKMIVSTRPYICRPFILFGLLI